jgi:hypothetical protein
MSNYTKDTYLLHRKLMDYVFMKYNLMAHSVSIISLQMCMELIFKLIEIRICYFYWIQNKQF